MNKNYIVLNGKHYDAVTGALITPSAPTLPAKPKVHKPSVSSHATHSAHKPQAKKPVSRAHHTAPKKLAAHKPAQPKTLMRKVVKKPTHAKKTAVKKVYPVAKKTAGPVVAPKSSAANVDSLRFRRAQQVNKSHKVTRFASPAKTPLPTKLTPIAIKPAPSHGHAHAKVQVAPQVNEPTPAQKKTAMLEKALVNAKSHELPAHKPSKSHRRLLSSLAGLGAILVIGSFVAYMNKPSVELQVASVKAGFQASMPSYSPSGYERAAVKANDGKVAINFTSPNQQNGFTVTQESSGWDSQTLFDSITTDDTVSYQTVQSNGRTIYIYDNDKAAWVDGGILYRVSGDAKLNSDQIISLATSM